MAKHGSGTPVHDEVKDEQKVLSGGYAGKHEKPDTPAKPEK